jgi:hypothetical protein
MKKHFYTHLIEIDSLHVALEALDLEEHEKKELIILAETTIHHIVIDTVLTELPEGDKKKFLKHLAEENHADIWNLLKSKGEQMESKIKRAIESIQKELHADIKEAHKKKR